MPKPSTPPDPEARDEPELVIAARAGDVGRVRELVQAGADLDARGPSGASALEAALAAGHGGVARLLRTVGARGAGPALARAADRGDLAEVERLLAAGESADAAAADRAGRRVTPLHRAALRGHAEVVTALLRAGAAVDARVAGGPPPWDRSALHLAAAAGHEEIVGVLVEAGADTGVLDLDAYGTRRSAADLARAAGHDALAERLDRLVAPRPGSDLGTPLGTTKGSSEAAVHGSSSEPAAPAHSAPGRYAARRGLHLDEGVHVPALVLVHAEVEAVAEALQRLEGARTWWRDVHGESAELTRRAFAVLRLEGHRWTLVSSLLAGGPHLEEADAVRLGVALGVPALRTAASADAESGASYAYFDGQVCLERMVWRRGHELDYESHLQDLSAENIADPRTRADVFLAELDAWAPHHLGPLGRPGEELRLDLGLDEADVERLDFVAVW